MGFLKGKFALLSLAAVALCACGDDSSNSPEQDAAAVADSSTVDGLAVDTLPNVNLDSLSGSENPNSLGAESGEVYESSSSLWLPFSSSSFLEDFYPSSSSFRFGPSLSSANAIKRSPAKGTSLKPIIETGVLGKATFKTLENSFVILLALPYVVPTTK